DRIIAFENVLIVRIPPAPALERNVAATRATVTIAIIFGKDEAPAIGRFTSLWRRRRTSWWRRDGNIDNRILAGFDHNVLECVTANYRKVAVVFVFIKLSGIWLVQAEAIRAGLE